ncbi:class I SAM-dependent methyltransferase [Pelobacter seleniigenes]|uniref:class I SAM-dependent methyltransferase n=1 Tax=Pelobacter seleniigenes TaxID=407188 RepID=UPI0004A74972|nr:class I SAM-dependent methyltransferase [Pelobacter seleniigenes]
MKFYRQVDKTHYEFHEYVNKPRWNSIWHQIDEVISLKPNKVLEVGVGSGIFKSVISLFGIVIETIDIDKDLNPDYIGSVISMPFNDDSYDIVCAFQVLEHLPYADAIRAFHEISRVSKRYIVLSIPDFNKVWRYQLYIPKLGEIDFFIPRPSFFRKIHRFDGEHYWEIGKKQFSLRRIVDDFSFSEWKLLKTYRVRENPYHRFFIYERI